VHGALVEATIGNTVALSLHARGSQTKLLHFHAVAKNARLYAPTASMPAPGALTALLKKFWNVLVFGLCRWSANFGVKFSVY
jgi:hypothetical protein